MKFYWDKLLIFQFVSSSGNLKFLDEIQSIKEEVENLKAQGVKILIGLGHAGYPKDMEIAKNIPDLDLIIGAHTHTFLYNDKNKLPSVEKPLGDYPTIVKSQGGKNVDIVQAFAYTKYLGKIDLVINDDGEIESYDGNPLLLDSTYEKGNFFNWVDHF